MTDINTLARFLFLLNDALETQGDEQTRLVKALYAYNPNAFLIALVLDQSVRAEKVWAIPPFGLPWDFNNLDKLSPEKIVADVKASGYRFPNRAAEHIIYNIHYLYEMYDGRAMLIWDEKCSLPEIEARLRLFKGIGPKKSALALNLLVRSLKVIDGDRSKIDVAYDIHLRLVFLRSGIAQIDEIEHMKQRARELLPSYPGSLDVPCWYIGRKFCHPQNPDCKNCWITGYCNKLIERNI